MVKKVFIKLISVLLIIIMSVLAFCGCANLGSITEENTGEFTESEGDVQTETTQTESAQTEPTQTEPAQTEPTQDDDTKTYIDIDKDTLPYTQQEIYEQLFDINNKIEIDIDISDAELAKIQSDYDKYSEMGSKSPVFRLASVDIKITTSKDSYTYHIEEVGIRMKGNTSRTSFYDEEEGIYNLVHFKLDFQETFDDKDYYGSSVKEWDADLRNARKDRTFATLEKIDIKWNRNNDATFIREYYAYETYRANGVLAPHTNITAVDMAEEHLGMYTLYEPIDKIFIEKYVAEEDQGGDLYKCGWTYMGANMTSDCSIGVEDEDKCKFYNYDLKTNKKTSENTELVNLIEYLNGGDVSKEELANYVDIDNFLKFEAVSYFLGNPDDVRNNYNNHYIYFLKSSGKVIFIPYDMDRCLGVTNGWNPDGTGMSESNPFSKYALGANERQVNPLYKYTVIEGGFYVKEFAEVLKIVADSEYFTESKFNSLYEIARNNYSELIKPSKTFYNTEDHSFEFSNLACNGNMSFKEYIDAKMEAFNNNISKAETDSPTNNIQPYYIRGSFNGWNVEEKYEMTYDASKEIYSYVLKIKDRSELKVNNGIDSVAGDWYGYEEVISYNGLGQMNEGDQGNIVLQKGTYTITFNAKDKTITIE